MATVQNTTNTPSQALLDAMNGKRNSASSKVDEVQDRFMTLLVSQMKNQDPLNPMDNAQVTSQMAQLSTVTGIDKLNNTLETLMSSFQMAQSYQASSMIGHYVLTPGNTITTEGEGGYFGVDLPVGADKLSVKIKDGSGNLIRTVNLGKQDTGITSFMWDGYKDDGAVAPAGNYKVEITATTGNSSVTATSLGYAKVISVSNDASGVKLNLSNMATVSTSDVKEIFNLNYSAGVQHEFSTRVKWSERSLQTIGGDW